MLVVRRDVRRRRRRLDADTTDTTDRRPTRGVTRSVGTWRSGARGGRAGGRRGVDRRGTRGTGRGRDRLPRCVPRCASAAARLCPHAGQRRRRRGRHFGGVAPDSPRSGTLQRRRRPLPRLGRTHRPQPRPGSSAFARPPPRHRRRRKRSGRTARRGRHRRRGPRSARHRARHGDDFASCRRTRPRPWCCGSSSGWTPRAPPRCWASGPALFVRPHTADCASSPSFSTNPGEPLNRKRAGTRLSGTGAVV